MKAGRHLSLTVKDSGHGMTPEVLERIFEPYYTTKEQGKGTGLGLSVIHGIIKNHGGDISVCSQPGVGSTFSVYLPVILYTKDKGFSVFSSRNLAENPLEKGFVLNGSFSMYSFIRSISLKPYLTCSMINPLLTKQFKRAFQIESM